MLIRNELGFGGWQGERTQLGEQAGALPACLMACALCWSACCVAFWPAACLLGVNSSWLAAAAGAFSPKGCTRLVLFFAFPTWQLLLTSTSLSPPIPPVPTPLELRPHSLPTHPPPHPPIHTLTPHPPPSPTYPFHPLINTPCAVEMFEHMKNYQLLLRRIAGWLRPGGRLFVHIFVHRGLPYHYEVQVRGERGGRGLVEEDGVGGAWGGGGGRVSCSMQRRCCRWC